MTDAWIQQQIEEINELFEACGESEIAIRDYLVSLKRLLIEVSAMGYSEFYFYEKNVLNDAMHVFSEQFLGQVKVALECENSVKKRKIILNLEDALTRVIDVFKNAVDNSANSDRQIFTNLPIDSNVYNISPKLNYFYADILKRIVNIFSGDERKYVFLIFPSIRYNTEAIFLLEYSETNDRTIIIYISGSSMESIGIVPIFLVHEAFHTLTIKQRNRFLRTKALIRLMIYGLQQHIFKNVNFPTENNYELRDRLMDEWFMPLRTKFDEFKKLPWDDRQFYSKEIVQELSGLISESMSKIIITEDYKIQEKIITYFDLEEGFDRYKIKYLEVLNDIKKLKANVCNIIHRGLVYEMLNSFMRIFREGYADIALLLTLPDVEPSKYEMAFENSIRFKENITLKDPERILRSYLVSDAIKEYMADKEIWEAYSENRKTTLHSLFNTTFYGQPVDQTKFSALQQESSYVILSLSDEILFELMDYLGKCASDLYNYIEETDDSQLNEFRQKMGELMDDEKRDMIMANIMKGQMLFS